MYFPIGWPINLKLLPPDAQNATINYVSCDAVRILIAACSDSILGIWYANPLIPITFYTRTDESVSTLGANKTVIWKPDSRQLLILTSLGNLLLYYVNFEENVGGVMTQKDPPTTSLKRDSAELFIKENVPRLSLQEVGFITVGSAINTVNCISLTELLVSLEQSLLLRVVWADLEENARDMEKDFSLLSDCVIDVKNIPLYANHQCHVKRLPALIAHAPAIACLEYSPFIGGCAVVFSNKRAAFLIAKHLRFEEQNMHGYWVPDLDDATVCSVNHKFRLLAYGRQNSEVCVYGIEDGTGDLEFSHRLVYEHNNSMQDMLGDVCELRWSPDGCVIVVAWQRGGISLWSTFGSLLMCSLNWDFGLHVDLQHFNPIQVAKMEWSTEGYQLFMTCRLPQLNEDQQDNVDYQMLNTNVLQLNFVKSSLSMNPCMASHSHLLLQGDDTLYLNQGHSLEKMYFEAAYKFPNNQTTVDYNDFENKTNFEYEKAATYASVLTESKHWSVIQLPLTYAATNWPIRYTSVDEDGLHIAVAGRTGLAHYSILTKKWKLFGNETQEKDFVVSGGLLWWQGFIVMGCYSILDRTDEIRYYREDTKLDNQFGNKILVRGPVITLNIFHEQLIILTGDGIVSLFVLDKLNASDLSVQVAYEIDVKSICIHPACIVALQITNLKHEQTSKTTATATAASNASTETIILNVCGRLLMFQRDSSNNFNNCIMTSCLASCVESFWLASEYEKGPMSDCLWLYCGVYGMRLWLPVQPPANEQMSNVTQHTFMSKRIMLSFPLKLYPLVILFDNVIVLGVENENTLYSSGPQQSHFSLPYNLLERKSQVYLHKILRQLIKRNLGYGAWKIAQSCRSLPYFPHALELLLHEVLEEEATSKEPIPDALLPSILDFIREYPVYLQTIVQCARKTEMALWPYLFSMAGKPKDIFQLCVQSNELETAASYLIILQNFESAIISKQHATMLLDICLQKGKWRLAKDLHRFLKAIDPNDIESPRSSMIVNLKIAPQPASQAQAPAVNQSEVLNLILGPIGRERSFSTTTAVNLSQRKDNKKEKTTNETNAANAAAAAAASAGAINETQMRPKTERLLSRDQHEETFGINEMLQQHAQTLLRTYNVLDLGNMSAYLDFHLVKWLSQETERSARFDDYVEAIVKLHTQLELAAPFEKSLQHADIDWMKLHDSYDAAAEHNMQQTTDEQSESGYYSHAIMDGAQYNGNFGESHMQSITEDKEQHITQAKYNYEAHPLNERLYRVQLESLGNATKQITLPEKLALKIRYLLQLFIEANCIDYALVLSILLQDAASIARIINTLTRSESSATTQRIECSLKDFTQRCFECESGYTSFMISIQPYIYLLEQYRKTKSKKSSGTGDLSKSQQPHGNDDAKNAARIKKLSRANLLRDTDASNRESLSLESVSSSLHSYHLETNNANNTDTRNVHSNRCNLM